MQTITIAVSYAPDLDNKTLLLKMPYTLVLEHRKMKLKLS